MKILVIAFFGLIGGTFFARWMGGTWFAAADTDIMNSLTVFKDVDIFNLFTVPALNIDFFVVGLPKLIQWDYPFFGGQAEILKYFLYCIALLVVFVLFTIAINVAGNFWSRR